MKEKSQAKGKSKYTTEHSPKPIINPITRQSINDERAPHHPHDKFVKCAFRNKEIAIDFFAAHLADMKFSRQMLEGFSLSNNEHQLPFRAMLANDIVYRGEIENQVYYIILEHQSSFNGKMIIRFLDYSLALMKEADAQRNGYVPLVLGVCLYHNTHSNRTPGFNHKTDLENYFRDGKRGQHALRAQLKYNYQLVDLTDPSMDYNKIAFHGHAAVLELFLKDAYLTGDAFITQTKAHLASENYQGMPTDKFGEFKLALYEYILSLGNKPPLELIKSLVEVAPAEEEIMLTAAEQLRQEGRLEFARTLMKEGVGIDFLRQKGHLSPEECANLSPSSAGSPSSLKDIESTPKHRKLIQTLSSSSANDNLVSGINDRVTTTNPEAGIVLPATRKSSRRTG